ncbi:synembryn-B isoform X2 [Trichomycterus rosablanca]|uniref:synembryn-B isoform X2 n=1 Tax=Trichomycterus rosablanca TaxID=2290929 RepID=UPI002F3566BB
MDLSSILSQIESGNNAEIEKLLHKYNTENCKTFAFDCKEKEARIKLCQGVLTVLNQPVQTQCQTTCLETLRILSRDKHVLGPVATRNGILTLARLACIRLPESDEGPLEETKFDSAEEERVVVEALKCFCNVVYNSVAAQQVVADVRLGQGLCARLSSLGSGHHEVGLFSLRLLFLLSALRADIRRRLRQEMNAVELLTGVLERTLDVRWSGPYKVTPPVAQAPHVSPEKLDLTMEALKALFNITMADFNDEHNEHQLRRVASIMRHILMLRSQTEEKTEEAHSHAINLLSNLPVSCLDVLIVSEQEGLEKYGGKNMDTLDVLVDFMEKRIDKGTNYKEGLTPVLSLLTESSRYHREFRRYLKAKVLPPLKDATERPEVGSTVRNKLVRLMTHVDMGVKQGAAEFLFVLCKESVDNLLKYTGYGNAAGLLVARGLLAGGRGDTEYSPDEDSDTEEYKSVKPFINPITGHIEEPMPNPTEGMTEEQKEYEAQKLAEMISELSRQQLIRPMSVRKDGSLAPLEEAMRTCTVPESSDSDSD